MSFALFQSVIAAQARRSVTRTLRSHSAIGMSRSSAAFAASSSSVPGRDAERAAELALVGHEQDVASSGASCFLRMTSRRSRFSQRWGWDSAS